MPHTQPALVDLPDDTVTRYVEAHQEIERRLGKSPGPEFLMSLAVEREDPMELIDLFCALIVQNVRETHN
jgi:hypothetical protein